VRVFANEDDLPKWSYPDLIQRLTLQYWEWQYFDISPSEKIAYFDTIKWQRKLRFISSYCNSFDENVCATHWELRVSHRLELKHCVMPSIVWINVSHFAQEGDIESIKNSLNQINWSLWKCP
jgi:hypothetical protein